MQVRGQKFTEQPEIFGVLCLEKILGKAFFLQVHLIKTCRYRFDQVVRFLPALIRGFFFGKIIGERGTHAVKGQFRAACFVVGQRYRIEFYRMLFLILVNIGGSDACLNLRLDLFKIGGSVRTCVQRQFSGKGRRDTANRSEYDLAVLRQSRDGFRGNFAKRLLVLCRRVLISKTRQDLPHTVDIKGNPLDGIDDFAARQIDQHDIAVLAHDLKDQLFGNRKAKFI